jgi:DNA polymerase III delta prime subunit
MVSLTEVSAGRDIYIKVDTAVRDEQFRRNRSQMLEKVRRLWIKGFLEESLDHLTRIELGLQTKPDAISRPFDLLVQHPKQVPQSLLTGTPISQIFMDSGNALLILGEPGAGKTTLLLELARTLLDRAQQDERHLIPVVFNLSSWAEQRCALADWLIDELNKRYDVPRALAKTWVTAELILPLLDGLDEVAADHREACVEAMNAFVNAHGLVPLVVCSRRAEYEALSVRLRLPSAVLIQSLSRQQVQSYVEQAGTSLAGLRTALQSDEMLWELLNTPLMLSIVVLAYHGRSAEEIHAAGTLEERRRHIFTAYTNAMFDRGVPTTPYTREQTEHWLTWLAKAMQDHNQTIFYLEWMQPAWLPVQRQQRLVTFLTSIMSGLLFGLSGGLSDGLLGGLRSGLSDGLSAGLASVWFNGLVGALSVSLRRPLVGGLSSGLFFGLSTWPMPGLLDVLIIGLFFGLHVGLSVMLVGYSEEIKPIEQIRWSWSAARYKWIRHLLRRLLYGLLVLCLFEVSIWVYGKQSNQVPPALLPSALLGCFIIGLVSVLTFGLLGGLKDGLTVGEITTHAFPNEGIRRSGRNALRIGLLAWLLGSLIIGLVGGLTVGLLIGLKAEQITGLGGLIDGLLGGLAGLLGGLIGGLIGWLPLGLLIGLVFGLRFGGRACLHHCALRLILWHKNFAPFHYIRFLDYATARIFLRKLGGGYVFVHRMLLEYFATLHSISAEQQK